MRNLIDLWLTGSLTILLLIIFVEFTIIIADIIETYSDKPTRFTGVAILIAIIAPLVIGGLMYILKLL